MKKEFEKEAKKFCKEKKLKCNIAKYENKDILILSDKKDKVIFNEIDEDETYLLYKFRQFKKTWEK